ncbi:hypothetical protein SIM33_27285 [Bacillus cereus group sp. BfR-BA-02490]|uniref:hypothetical protein n=1 Tax=Bacillus cereus group sp. BfR-BA-02490 TaxID=3094888 RepID=UPI0029C54C1B|nr:hypothetical protein [Bacillus cereus group sp. BfR-BA-02490]MDX5824158.1 hypothetical protein [Bacillus cereus group sp. BfR-BA-02490]
MKELIGAVLLFFMERYFIEPFVEYIEQKTRNLSIFTYVKATQAMNVAVEWIRVLKIVTFYF